MTGFSRDGITLQKEGDVFVLTIDRGQNWVNPELTSALGAAIEVVEKESHPKSLVITAKGKFFSNGLDVGFMMKRAAETPAMIESFYRVLARILTMDCHTVAAINGHAFGGGLFLATACDWRIMRTERGYLNFPELNLGMKLSKPFAELAKSKLSPHALREGVLLGKRWTSGAALQLGIVDKEVPVESLLAEAIKLAAGLTAPNLKLKQFNAKSFKQMKIELYTDAYRALVDGMLNTDPKARL